MTLAQALFTDSQSRVLRCLFGQPQRRYHWNALRRITLLGSASLQRELKRLVDAQVVTVERLGNLRLFQANPESAVFGALCELVAWALGEGVEGQEGTESASESADGPPR